MATRHLVLFGEKYTPNLHQLAKDYILYDNFYENADVSAEGHNWASAAIAPDYTVKLWPVSMVIAARFTILKAANRPTRHRPGTCGTTRCRRV